MLLPTTSAGPAVVAVDGEETDTQFSGKAGLGLPISDALSAYGEVSDYRPKRRRFRSGR